MFKTPEEALSTLTEMGRQSDGTLDLSEAGFAMALIDQPGISLDRYRIHIDKLCQAVRATHNSKEDTLAAQIETLTHVIHDEYEYRGDAENYNDLQNANLIRVIERRQGLPVAIGLLYLHTAWAQGWTAEGLNFPGHFIIRIEHEGQREIIDPFHKGRVLNAADMREIVKRTVGEGAELSHEFYDPVSRRDIILRLQNNLKTRLIASEDYAHALKIIEAMRAFAPEEYRLLLDAGVLKAKLEDFENAAEDLQAYVEKAPDINDRQEAMLLLAQIRDFAKKN